MSKRRFLNNASKLFDLLVLTVSFGAGAVSQATNGPVSFAQFLDMRIKLGNVAVFIALLWIWHLIFTMLGMYGSRRLAGRMAEVSDVVKATSLSALVLGLASVFLGFRMVNPVFIAIFWVVSTAIAASTRFALRTWLRRLRVQGRDSRNVLIIGSNQRAISFAKRIRSKPELGYRLIGFADDEWSGAEALRQEGWSLVCNLENISTFLRRSVVDEVIIAVPLRSFHDHASEVAAMCEQQGIIIRVLSDLFNLKWSVPITEEFDDAPLITQYAGNDQGLPMVVKRIMDISLSLILLVAIAPMLLLTALLIKLTSPGPVFFVQRRIGLNKRTFGICKFRTMSIDAEIRLREIEHLNEVSGPVFKIKNDPRITPLGKFLRKTSIDELPQLLNVLCGDMSLVGPRPLQLRDYELFTESGEDWQRCRFSVRPGITCLWQVNGRNSLPFQQWMELDLQYVRNWSLWLDLQILAKTVPAVLKGSGAA